METVPDSGKKPEFPPESLPGCFLQLANLPIFALDRFSRYEAALCRQAAKSDTRVGRYEHGKLNQDNKPRCCM
jgi:hypothetical protein